MRFLDLQLKNDQKVSCIGDLHGQVAHLKEFITQYPPSKDNILVSVGDIYDKSGKPEDEAECTHILQDLVHKQVAFVIKGNHELKHINRAKKADDLQGDLLWWSHQPLARFFVWDSGAKLTVLHAGVHPDHKLEDLLTDVKVAYIRDLDENNQPIYLKWVKTVDGKKELIPNKAGGKTWHEKYDGRFGYIASGHSQQMDGIAKFYNYSCNLDTACYKTKTLSCQVFGNKGRENLITIKL